MIFKVTTSFINILKFVLMPLFVENIGNKNKSIFYVNYKQGV